MRDRRFPRRALQAPATLNRGRATEVSCYVENASATGLGLTLATGRTCRVGDFMSLTLGGWDVPVRVVWSREREGTGVGVGVVLVSEQASRSSLRAFSDWIVTGFAGALLQVSPSLEAA